MMVYEIITILNWIVFHPPLKIPKTTRGTEQQERHQQKIGHESNDYNFRKLTHFQYNPCFLVLFFLGAPTPKIEADFSHHT